MCNLSASVVFHSGAVCAGSHPAANPHDYWFFCLLQKPSQTTSVQRMVCSELQPQGAGRPPRQSGTWGAARNQGTLRLQNGRERQQEVGGGRGSRRHCLPDFRHVRCWQQAEPDRPQAAGGANPLPHHLCLSEVRDQSHLAEYRKALSLERQYDC